MEIFCFRGRDYGGMPRPLERSHLIHPKSQHQIQYVLSTTVLDISLVHPVCTLGSAALVPNWRCTMNVGMFESFITGHWFSTEAKRIWSDVATLQAWLSVEAALASAQAEL